MKEMIKRKKDQGFTLIELMIVIAVIGILAIVLVPKVGTIKTQAKGAGVDTNLRAVQGYVESKINTWNNQGATVTTVKDDIIAAYTSDPLANPYTSEAVTPVSGDLATGTPGNNALFILTDGAGSDFGTLNATNTQGTIVVTISPATPGVGTPITSIKLIPHGNDGLAIAGKTVTITP